MNELDKIEAALAGDRAAAESLITEDTLKKLQAILVKRGASLAEAQDIVADLAGDCFGKAGGTQPLLRKYNGKGSFEGFLTRAAINRLIDYKRRGKFRGAAPVAPSESGPVDDFDRLAAEPVSAPKEEVLLDILRDSLVHAFSKCEPESLLFMRLVSVYGVNQGAIGTMMGWSQSKVSRAVADVMDTIKEVTVSEIQKVDDWLEIEFEDFVQLCRSSTDFLVGATS